MRVFLLPYRRYHVTMTITDVLLHILLSQTAHISAYVSRSQHISVCGCKKKGYHFVNKKMLFCAMQEKA